MHGFLSLIWGLTLLAHPQTRWHLSWAPEALCALMIHGRKGLLPFINLCIPARQVSRALNLLMSPTVCLFSIAKNCDYDFFQFY